MTKSFEKKHVTMQGIKKRGLFGFTLLSCSCGEDSVEGSRCVMVAIKIYKKHK